MLEGSEGRGKGRREEGDGRGRVKQGGGLRRQGGREQEG
jgi:hypothetical protein